MMRASIKHIIAESSIINFCLNLNKRLVSYFYDSWAYGFFKQFNILFHDVVVKYASGSWIIKAIGNICGILKSHDLGWFIILVTLFNTAIMIVSRREIDVFSICARAVFLFFGLILVLKNNKK